MKNEKDQVVLKGGFGIKEPVEARFHTDNERTVELLEIKRGHGFSLQVWLVIGELRVLRDAITAYLNLRDGVVEPVEEKEVLVDTGISGQATMGEAEMRKPL